MWGLFPLISQRRVDYSSDLDASQASGPRVCGHVATRQQASVDGGRTRGGS